MTTQVSFTFRLNSADMLLVHQFPYILTSGHGSLSNKST